MQLKLMYRTIITDEKGKIVKRSHWKKSKSFVLQFLGLFDSSFSHAVGSGYAATISVKDTGNTARAMGATWNANQYGNNLWAGFAANNVDTYGVQVGTGVTAPTNTDYVLETLITTGVGSGQLSYGTHSRTAAQVVGANVDFVISRSFYNGSGATITVNEIGITVKHCDSTNPGVTYNFLIARDIVTPVNVDNLKTLTVQYTLRTTV